VVGNTGMYCTCCYDLDPIHSQGQGHLASEVPKISEKLHFSRSISSAVLPCCLKLMDDYDSVGCSLQLVGAQFLANVNSRYVLSPVLLLSVCLSSVCNVRVPYSSGSNFWQYFYGIRYLGHPLTFTVNFTEIVPGEPLRQGSLTQAG